MKESKYITKKKLNATDVATLTTIISPQYFSFPREPNETRANNIIPFDKIENLNSYRTKIRRKKSLTARSPATGSSPVRLLLSYTNIYAHACRKVRGMIRSEYSFSRI